MGCFERSTIYKPRVCPFYSFENRKSWVCGGCQRRQRCWYVQIFLFPGLFLSFRVDQEKPRGLLKNMFSKKPKKSTEAFLRISAKSITSVDRDASGYLPCGFCDIVLSTFLSLIDEEEGRRSLAVGTYSALEFCLVNMHPAHKRKAVPTESYD
mmetsp:Transcript_24399/g.61739  ORF Transcript_24399/g.61739 Transcript_24399/m.61739 type:complete len:153 (+) Transcript_24399:1145-1603(+)